MMSDEHGCRSHSRDRKRRLDRKETDDSHSQEKKEEEIQREKSKGVEKEKEFSKSKENFGSNQIIEDDQVFPVDGGRPNPRIQENNRKPELVAAPIIGRLFEEVQGGFSAAGKASVFDKGAESRDRIETST